MIVFNSADHDSIKELMKKYGNSGTMFFGETDDGEDMVVSINSTNIVVNVFQDNDRIRTTQYSIDPDNPESIIREISYSE